MTNQSQVDALYSTYRGGPWVYYATVGGGQTRGVRMGSRDNPEFRRV